MSQALPRTYVDTNIFIVLKEGMGGIPAALIDLIAATPASGGPWLATSELTLAELLVKPYVEHRDDLVDQYDAWMRPSNWLQVGPITREVLWYAATLRSQYRSLKLPDAIHLSTAFGFGCRYLLTADEGLKGTYSILHQRYGVSRESVEIEVLRPEIDVLERLKQEMISA